MTLLGTLEAVVDEESVCESESEGEGEEKLYIERARSILVDR